MRNNAPQSGIKRSGAVLQTRTRGRLRSGAARGWTRSSARAACWHPPARTCGCRPPTWCARGADTQGEVSAQVVNFRYRSSLYSSRGHMCPQPDQWLRTGVQPEPADRRRSQPHDVQVRPDPSACTPLPASFAEYGVYEHVSCCVNMPPAPRQGGGDAVPRVRARAAAHAHAGAGGPRQRHPWHRVGVHLTEAIPSG